MRIGITGSRGQVAMSLVERANPDIEIVPLRLIS
jgi:dTDP-4-dehydrorhamnose reductase